MKRCLLVGAAPSAHKELDYILQTQEFDAVYAVDGGYAALRQRGIEPDAVFGDFDSLGQAPQHPCVFEYDAHKDFTDMDLAIGYAEQQGYGNVVHYTDDGYSGTNFNRPSWGELLERIENGEVATLIVKDMSRLRRDYLKVGFYTEVLFVEKEVRFIAINNGIDSANQQDSDFNFTPFLNIINEWYAKDTSKKSAL